MNYKILEPKIPYDKDDNIIDKILKIRGIENREDFLFPSEKYLNSPWDLSNMETVANMIAYCIQNKLRIGIYGDIDCDGVCSLAIMHHFLKYHNNEPVLIYHQRSSGHGVIGDNVPKDLDLLIIVDSSTNSVDECKKLSEDMNIIILDHHESDVENPYAYICNPQLNNYPNKALSGGAVCYKTCQAVDELMCTNYADNVIDFCATSLISDMMDMTELETRHLANKGLFKISKNPSMQLKAILKYLKKDFMPNATTIGFYVAPFINSIIRLNQIQDIVTILTSNDEKLVKDTVKRCGKLNDERKKIQAKIVKEIESNLVNTHKVIFYIAEPKENEKTLNGLVANSIMQKYKKPTFILSKNNKNDTYVGSGRVLGDVDIKKIIADSGLDVQVAGHGGAFGIDIKCNQLKDLILYLDRELKNVTYDSSTLVDLEFNQQDITWELLSDINKLSFCVGEGFKEPLFLIKYLFKTDSKIMKDIHIKLQTNDLDCLKFNCAEDEIEKLEKTFCFDVIGSLGINSFYNFKTKETVKSKQVLIKDINTY